MKLAPFFVAVGLLSALPVVPVAQLAAQAPGDDRGSLVLAAGVLLSGSELDDGTSFTSGAAFGLSGRLWLTRSLGIQGTALHAATGAEADGVTPTVHYQPTAFVFGIGPVVRYTTTVGGLLVSPQVGASVGAKGYRWTRLGQGLRSPAVGLAWDLVGGIEVRRESSPGLGLLAEVRRVASQFGFLGFRNDPQEVSDIALTLGISLNR